MSAIIPSSPSLTTLSYKQKVDIALYVDLESLLKVARVNKEFYQVAGDQNVWQSLASKMLIPLTSQDSQDPKTAPHAKSVLIARINDRVHAFLFLDQLYTNISAHSVIARTNLATYKNTLAWFANHLDVTEQFFVEDNGLEEHEDTSDCLLETAQHAHALVEKSKKLQEQRKTKERVQLEI
jgi:hypothetical protein